MSIIATVIGIAALAAAGYALYLLKGPRILPFIKRG